MIGRRIRRFAIGPWLRRTAIPVGSVVAIAATAWGADPLLVASGDVRVSCPLTVGGSFEARTTAVEGTLSPSSTRPTRFTGEVSVDLRTLDTGINLRNDHLRGEYLEVDKGDGFEKAVVSEIDLGDIDWGSFHGKTGFTGMFRLHGTRAPIAGEAKIERRDGAIQVEATFPVSLTDYGIAEPRYLGVGVKDRVQAKVSLVLRPSSRPGGDR